MIGGHELPNDWQQVRLRDVATVVMGQSPPGTVISDWDGTDSDEEGLPFLQGNAEFGSRYPSPLKFSAKRYKVALTGDQLISVRAPVGATNLADRDLVIGRGLAAIRFTGADPAFGLHMVEHSKAALRRVSQGSTFAAVNSADLRNLRILLPPSPEQRAIAEVLETIDEAIERTDAVIAATERLRDSLLHELLTRGIPGRHTEWKQVPRLGTIPASWKVVPLGDVSTIGFSSVDKKTVDGEIQVRLCNYTDVFYHRRIRHEMEFMTATATSREQERWTLKMGDVLFTKDSETPREIGIPSLVECDLDKVLCGYHLGLARPIPHLIDGAYLAESLGSRPLATQFARIANGTTRFGLTLGDTRRLPIPLPPLGEQRSIAGALLAVDRTLEETKRCVRSLRQLKASTAESLLSGRVRLTGISDV